jgi:hypothetical protein
MPRVVIMLHVANGKCKNANENGKRHIWAHLSLILVWPGAGVPYGPGDW